MSQELKIALCQMTSVDDVDSNFQQIQDLVSQVTESVRLFCFPENCLYLRTQEGEAIPPFTLQDEVFRKLAHLAQAKKAFFHLGSVPLQMTDGLYNASVIISDQGTLETSYQKIHLFDIQLTGQKAIRESDVFRFGKNRGVFVVDDWKIAQSICYDLRFAELYAMYAREHVDVILVPSAFLVKTGEAHWEVLLRARAIESQCYVLAAAQAGQHVGKKGGSRQTYGHSMVVGPWGEVARQLDGTSKQTLVLSLSKQEITKVRAQIPMAQHRRLSL